MDEVELPGGQQIEDRRSGERRREERRQEPRRAADLSRTRTYQFQAVGWAIVGSVVVLYLFLLGLNAFAPGEAPVATAVVLGLAVAWLAHAWRRILAGGFVSRPDRERRGF